jgi:hypothetical protein
MHKFLIENERKPKKTWKTGMKEEFIACKQEGHDCIAGVG